MRLTLGVVAALVVVASAGSLRHRRHEEHTLEDSFGNVLDWLSEAQKDELRAIKDDKPAIHKKVEEFFHAAPEDQKPIVAEKLKAGCKHLVEDAIGAEKFKELKELKESGASPDQMAEKALELINAAADSPAKTRVLNAKDCCAKIFRYGLTAASRRRRHEEHTLEDAFGNVLDWLSDDQKQTLRGMDDRAAIHNKVEEFFNAAPEDQKPAVIEKLKAGCKHLLEDAIGAEKVKELRELRESGSSVDQLLAKALELVNAADDSAAKTRALNAKESCGKIVKYGVAASRRRRHEEHTLEDSFGNVLDWLSDAQKDELRAVKDDKEAIHKKIGEFFGSAPDDVKPKAAEKLKAGCKHLLEDVIGAENFKQIKELKESGASTDQIHAKALELVNSAPDSPAKTRALNAKEGCAKIFKYGAAEKSRRRRHEEHTLEGAFETVLSWLSDEQKDALRSIKEDKEAVHKKIEEFYESSSADVKPVATEKLKAGCKHLLEDAIGAEKAAELKTLRESGATYDQMHDKAMELINAAAEGPAKERLLQSKEGCKKIFKVPSRRRRHEVHTLEGAFETILTWLSDEQKDALRAIKDDKAAVHKKIEEFYESASADVKPVAAEKLKAGCKHLLEDAIGAEKASELKTLRESGATYEQMHDKAMELINAAAEGPAKERLLQSKESCKKIFKVPSRKRRHEEHTLEGAFGNVLDWLTDAQKDALRAIKEDKTAVYNKIEEYFETAPADVKPVAAEKLKAGCLHLMEDLIGAEKVAEIKTLKESGASFDQMNEKVTGYIEAAPEGPAKERVRHAGASCKKLYKVDLAAGRKRREHKRPEWLTDEQNAEIEKIRENGGSMEDIKNKAMEFYRQLPAEKQKVWNEHYKKECAEWLHKVASAEEIAELKALYESKDLETVETKVNEYKGRLDEKTRKEVDLWKDECRKVWQLAPSRRLRNTFEDFSAWMTDDQRTEIQEAKMSGSSYDVLKAKTLAFFSELPADKQAEIKADAMAKCKTYFAQLATPEEVQEMKSLYESGKHAEVKAAIDRVIARQEPNKKEQALKYQQICHDVFGQNTARRLRKDINTLIDKHLSWLDETQKQEIRDMKASGKSNADIKEKVLSYLNGLEGEKKVATKEALRKGCYAWLNKAATQEEVKALHKLHETDHGACKTKVREYIKRLPQSEQDEVNKNLPFCEKIWYGDHADHHHHHKRRQVAHGEDGHPHSVARRERRESEAASKVDQYKEFLGWLTPEQFKQLKEQDSREEIYKKVMDFYAHAEGETKSEAATSLKGACKKYIGGALGEEKTAELKALKESGASTEQMAAKVKEFVADITDAETKQKLEKAVAHCERIFKESVSRKRRDHHHHEKQSLDFSV